ncbi:unnamed protein product [Brassicogethes aeneus]|uniref:Bromodomain associated domain-containing protein n=1 Tax=Brassicogethes aeneus TaxID=1431903 RepID=A0A9P0FFF1_BRAAE|nr:unnamed protein product [Brassicogethes aeneus]
MSAQYSQEELKIAIAKILLSSGWSSVQMAALEVTTDVVSRFLRELGRKTNGYANIVGQSEPNLDHLGVAFRDFNVTVRQLEDFVCNGKCPTPRHVPRYPVKKD